MNQFEQAIEEFCTVTFIRCPDYLAGKLHKRHEYTHIDVDTLLAVAGGTCVGLDPELNHVMFDEWGTPICLEPTEVASGHPVRFTYGCENRCFKCIAVLNRWTKTGTPAAKPEPDES